MAKVIVKNGDLKKEKKKFTRILIETKKAYLPHTFYLRPGLKAIEKSKNAQRKKYK